METVNQEVVEDFGHQGDILNRAGIESAMTQDASHHIEGEHTRFELQGMLFCHKITTKESETTS